MLHVRAAIVAYDPGPALADLCRALRAADLPVHVIDNGSTQGIDRLDEAESLGATVTRLGVNSGVAGALTVALDAAAADDWLLTLDQDSRLLADTAGILARSSAVLDPRVAIVAPLIHDEDGAGLVQGDAEAGSWYLTDKVLTSGALCLVAALRDVGGYRRELFIDLVDWDLCFRLRASGWSIAIEPAAGLLHSIGHATRHHVPVLGDVVTTNHSADRQYYKVRNFLLLAREGTFGAEPGWAARTWLGLLFGAGKVVAFESDKRAKLRAMVRGVADGLAGRGGPRPAPAGWRPRSRPPFEPGERPAVSVCMATYNGSAHLRAQVDTILAQLMPGDELLVQDDCSTDDTVTLVESYGDPRIKLEGNAVNAGVIPTFERVLARATHDLVFLSDQDDEWLPGKVEAVVGAFADPAVMGVVTDAVIVDETGLVPDQSYFAHAHSGPGVVHNFLKNSYLGCCLAVRREVLDVALPVPRAVRTHDGWIGICADMLGRVAFLDTPYVRYRRHGANASQMHRFGLLDIVRRRGHLAAHLARIAPVALRRR